MANISNERDKDRQTDRQRTRKRRIKRQTDRQGPTTAKNEIVLTQSTIVTSAAKKDLIRRKNAKAKKRKKGEDQNLVLTEIKSSRGTLKARLPND